MYYRDSQPNKQASTQFVQLRQKQGSYTHPAGAGFPAHEEGLHGQAGKSFTPGHSFPSVAFGQFRFLFPHWTGLVTKDSDSLYTDAESNPKTIFGGSRRGYFLFTRQRETHQASASERVRCSTLGIESGFYNRGSKVGC